MPYPHLAGVNYESMVDGEGVRATFYLSGCSHNCPGCHNPETHSPEYGVQITEELIKEMACEIAKRPFINGITLSGGDPFYNPLKTLHFYLHLLEELHMQIKNRSIPDLWVYTGATFEDLCRAEDTNVRLLLMYTKVLVDGPYIMSCADKSLPFRGSMNQRIIDVQKTIEKGEITIYKKTEDKTA